MADRWGETYDAIVIGAGPAGENAADYASQRGLSTVIVEAGLVGGECSYWACMPSKALLRPIEALAAARRVPAAAAAVTGHLDVAAALRSRDAFTSRWDDAGQVSWLESSGIDLVRGHGRLVGERRVEVTTEAGDVLRLEARRGVVIAVGTRPAVPPIDGVDAIGAWDNRDVTSTTRIPRRLIVIGGGVTGVEMAQAMHGLGAQEVTIVEPADRLLGREESFVGEQLLAAFTDQGIRVQLGSRAERVVRDEASGEVTATLDDGRLVVGDELLLAAGRRPRTDELGLDSIGVEPTDRGAVQVDDHLRVVGHDWLFVVGDANGRAPLTHQGKYQARLVGDALGGIDVDDAWADEHAVPRVVFTDPQVAAVGLTRREATAAGLDVLALTHGIGETAGGALLGRGVSGTAQLLVDDRRRVIVGATFVGPGVSELLHAATIAIAGEVPIPRLWHAVPAFPTVSEVWLRLLEHLRRHDLGL